MENEGIVLNAYVKTMPTFTSTYDEDNESNITDESSEVGAPSTDLVQDDRETKVCVPDSVLELHKHRLENKDSVERDRKTTAVDILRRNFGRSRSRRNFTFTEDYRDPEDVVFTISNMQMGHSETNEEHSDHNGQIEVKLECQTESEFSDVEEIEIRPDDSEETFESRVKPKDDGSTREVKQHVYCSVYCIANDSYRNSVDITDGEEDRTVTPWTSNTSLEQNTQSPQQSDSEVTVYPEPFTLADLVDATALNNFYNGDSSLSAVLTCRICLEDKHIKPLHCCKKAVCEECLETYISSQVRVGRAAVFCPITECSGFLEESVVLAHLPAEDVDKYKYFLELSRLDAGTKPCPQCSQFTSLKSRGTGAPATTRSAEHKYKIQCSKCQFVWCFRCHAPWHDGLKCRDYRKGDKLLRDWASVIEHGQRNAQKCPRCKIHIQRTEGCDHMTCTQCSTNFCYRCGERYRHMRFFGDHTSDLSVFGCKYRYLPNKPHLRRFVRGSVCVTKLLLCPLVMVLTVVVGAVVIVVALLIFPIYCCKKRRKRPQGTEYWFS